MNSIWDGVVIGGAGGAIAGVTVWLVQFLQTWWVKRRHKKRVYGWLRENTSDSDGDRFRSTRTLASWNDLTEDRIRHICSVHKKIYLSTGEQEDMWSLYEHGDRSVYEHRGLREV